jgi:hypothetical protein
MKLRDKHSIAMVGDARISEIFNYKTGLKDSL